MKKLLLAALLALPLSAVAITEHEDGSVTLNRDEAQAVLENINRLMIERLQYFQQWGGAMEAIKEMQQKIESFERAKCV